MPNRRSRNRKSILWIRVRLLEANVVNGPRWTSYRPRGDAEAEFLTRQLLSGSNVAHGAVCFPLIPFHAVLHVALVITPICLSSQHDIFMNQQLFFRPIHYSIVSSAFLSYFLQAICLHYILLKDGEVVCKFVKWVHKKVMGKFDGNFLSWENQSIQQSLLWVRLCLSKGERLGYFGHVNFT